MPASRPSRRRQAGLAVAIAAPVAWLGAAALLHGTGATATPPQGQHDAIIVLGCRVDADGRASVALHARVEQAAALYHAGVAPRLVMTGGVGDGGVAEARVAADVAIALGVPPDTIAVEDTSTSTEGNARHAAALLDASRVVIVSDAYHLFRARRVFARYFDDVAVSASHNPDRQARWFGALREVGAVGVYALRGRL